MGQKEIKRTEGKLNLQGETEVPTAIKLKLQAGRGDKREVKINNVNIRISPNRKTQFSG